MNKLAEPTSLQPSTDEFPAAEISNRDNFMQTINQNFYLLNGELVNWQGAMTEVKSPFKLNGKEILVGAYPDLGADQAKAAVDSSARAYDRGLGEWPQMAPEKRIECLEKFVELILDKREEVSQLLMHEIAKPKRDCYKEFDRTIEYIEQTITAYRDLLVKDGKQQTFPAGLTACIDRTPLGVTLCMGPFNYPFNETMTSMIPALIMGNTVIMKPARFGVMLFEPMLQALKEAFPAGVVNVVYGDGAKVVTPIMESGKIDVLAFIGSTRVADILSRSHPEPHRLTKILGLGAHNPVIICADVDLDKIMPEILAGSLTFNGQRCTTLALHYAHKSIAAEYAEKLGAAVSQLKCGMPWEEDVNITPLAEGASKIKYLRELIDDAVSKGARVVNKGGGTFEDNLMIPAVLYPVTDKMRIVNEEQFGPIIPIVEYENENQVLRQMADSRFGQQASIFGSDLEKISPIAFKARNLVARVNINSQSQRGPDELPFTGRKDSALGVLSVTEALKAFSLPTVIASKR